MVSNPEIPEVYDPDGIDSFEFGWKSTLRDQTVMLNGAIYHMKWDGFQTVLYDLLTAPLNFRRNVDGATITGVEIDSAMVLGNGLSLTGGVSFNQAWLKDTPPVRESPLPKTIAESISTPVIVAPSTLRLKFNGAVNKS